LPPAGYAVREADAADVEEELVALWAANLNMGGDPRDKFRWFYVGNPLGEARAFLVEANGAGSPAAVGTCGVGPRAVACDGRTLRAGLLADFALAREHRTVMPGLVLQRALAAYARGRFDLSYAFPNDAAIGILRRIGYRLLGRTGRYVRLLRVQGVVARRLRSRPLARLLSLVPDAALAVTDAAKASILPRTLALEWTREADARFDRLWERTRARHPFAGERTAAFLRWRFTERPGLPGQLAALVDRETGEVRAYAAIVEKVKGVALVADFLAEHDDALRALFRRLFPALRARGFDQALTYFLGAAGVEEVLRDVGFSFRNPAKNLVVDAPADSPVPMDPARWYVTEADRDN
jgi:hypothetical protein